MKRSTTIIAGLVLSLVFLGVGSITAQAAGTQVKQQTRQESTVRNRDMKQSGTATQAGTLQRNQHRQLVQKRISQPVD